MQARCFLATVVIKMCRSPGDIVQNYFLFAFVTRGFETRGEREREKVQPQIKSTRQLISFPERGASLEHTDRGVSESIIT